MKVVMLNTSDSTGGAAKAAYRLYNEVTSNHETIFIVQDKKHNNKNIVSTLNRFHSIKEEVRKNLDILPLKIKHTSTLDYKFSLNWLNSKVPLRIHEEKPNIVHMHWINNGFMSINDLKNINVPVVWTLHDSWAFTGGCHVPLNCKNYKDQCGHCPLLKSKNAKDLSFKLYKNKKRIYGSVDLTIVTPSTWLANSVKESSLLGKKPVHIIPNGIDIKKFNVFNKDLAKRIIGIDEKQRYILFCAYNAFTERVKGFDYLNNSLKKIKSDVSYQLLIIGENEKPENVSINADYKSLGYIQDDISLNVIYNSVDLLVISSLSENLPNTALESLACGTPVVGFDIGGISEIIEHKYNGYLAQPFDSEDLAAGINWVLHHPDYSLLSQNARETAERKFDIRKVTQRYLQLYREILAK